MDGRGAWAGSRRDPNNCMSKSASSCLNSNDGSTSSSRLRLDRRPLRTLAAANDDTGVSPLRTLPLPRPLRRSADAAEALPFPLPFPLAFACPALLAASTLVTRSFVAVVSATAEAATPVAVAVAVAAAAAVDRVGVRRSLRRGERTWSFSSTPAALCSTTAPDTAPLLRRFFDFFPPFLRSTLLDFLPGGDAAAPGAGTGALAAFGVVVVAADVAALAARCTAASPCPALRSSERSSRARRRVEDRRRRRGPVCDSRSDSDDCVTTLAGDTSFPLEDVGTRWRGEAGESSDKRTPAPSLVSTDCDLASTFVLVFVFVFVLVLALVFHLLVLSLVLVVVGTAVFRESELPWVLRVGDRDEGGADAARRFADATAGARPTAVPSPATSRSVPRCRLLRDSAAAAAAGEGVAVDAFRHC